jgi:thiamine biosynthesis lipoprotein
MSDRSTGARFRATATVWRGIAASAVAVAVSACSPGSDAPRTIDFSGPAMGTTWSVKVVPGPGGLEAEESRAIDRGIRDELARINQLMSTWDPASELSRFNASSSLEPFPVAPETFDVFRWSVEIWHETGGAFDPSIAPLIDLWGFGVKRDLPVPDDATVQELKSSVVGMTLVELDPDGRWVRKRAAGVRCDFSALAPGYAADRIARRLLDRGVENFLIDVSGELVGRGRNESGQPWQVGIERPQAEGRASARVVPLRDGAMATSGDYRNFREVNGERLTHILDPRSGRPVHHALASVTVFDALAVRADALSTALMAVGPDEAQVFASTHRVPALFLIRLPGGSFEERRSAAFDALVSASAGSTEVAP